MSHSPRNILVYSCVKMIGNVGALIYENAPKWNHDRRQLGVKLPTYGQMQQQRWEMWEESEKRWEEKSRRKKINVPEKVEKSRNMVFFKYGPRHFMCAPFSVEYRRTNSGLKATRLRIHRLQHIGHDRQRQRIRWRINSQTRRPNIE